MAASRQTISRSPRCPPKGHLRKSDDLRWLFPATASPLGSVKATEEKRPATMLRLLPTVAARNVYLARSGEALFRPEVHRQLAGIAKVSCGNPQRSKSFENLDWDGFETINIRLTMVSRLGEAGPPPRSAGRCWKAERVHRRDWPTQDQVTGRAA